MLINFEQFSELGNLREISKNVSSLVLSIEKSVIFIIHHRWMGTSVILLSMYNFIHKALAYQVF